MYFQYRTTVPVNENLGPNGPAIEASKRVKAIKHDSLTALIKYIEPTLPEDGNYDIVFIPAEIPRHFFAAVRIANQPVTEMHYIREVLG